MRRVLRLSLKLLKYAGLAVGGLLLLLGGFLLFLTLKPASSRPASRERVEVTPERLARGEYLFNHVSTCGQCHSEHLNSYGWPVKPGTEGGGLCMDKHLGFPSEACAPNITPDRETGIGTWTDGELMRAIREGVSRDGRALFWMMMPFQSYRSLSDEDVRSLVVYLRSLPPLERHYPPPSWEFPFDLAKKLFPKPLEGPVTAPPRSDALAYGRYLVEIGRCRSCHGDNLSGGATFDLPDEVEYVPNITPDPQTGMTMTREEFIGRIKSFATLAPPAREEEDARPVKVFMPWIAFSGMTEEDLGLIYDYLRTVPPVVHPRRALPPPAAGKP